MPKQDSLFSLCYLAWIMCSLMIALNDLMSYLIYDCALLKMIKLIESHRIDHLLMLMLIYHLINILIYLLCYQLIIDLSNHFLFLSTPNFLSACIDVRRGIVLLIIMILCLHLLLFSMHFV